MKPFDRVLAFSQLFILGLWEAVGIVSFDWNPFVIAAVWFVGLWTFNVLTATAVRTYYKLMEPQLVITDAPQEED